MALPRPAPARRVFRPARRVSWGTWIFVILVLLIAVGALGAFLTFMLPQRVAQLAQSEAGELQLARKGTGDVSTNVSHLWADISAKGSMSLSNAQLTQDLALANSAQKSADEALGHVQLAQSYIAQADGLPFQLHAAAFIATDRPALDHLDKALLASEKLIHAAILQLTLAQQVTADAQKIPTTLDPALNAHAWADAARASSALAEDLKPQQVSAAFADALLDPLWANWIDAMLAIATSAQQYSLAAAANQTQSAQQSAKTLAAARQQFAASFAAAQNGAAAWQAKTIQPLLDTVTRETTAGS
ncbi:MAG: hypothetical protein E6I86_03200 [Chloroflexi bacterium]|nr:MAG: hypothetical protein E6I86_03200 [Chloroflexota bacterium]